MMGEADLLCDRIGIMDHGKIVALDTSTNLKKMISGANTTILTLEISNLTPELVTMVRALECVEAVSQENSSHLKIHAHGDDAFDTIIDAVRASKAKIDSIQNIQPTLEDVFLHVTGHEVRDSADQKIPMEHRRFAAPSRSKVRRKWVYFLNSFRIAWKDLLELFRNRLGLVMLILMPLFMMVMVGYIYPSNNTLSNVPVALANQDVPYYNSTAGSQYFLSVLQGINNTAQGCSPLRTPQASTK